MIVVTGATGQLGYQLIDHLLERGIPADRIVAANRDSSGSMDFDASGV